MILRWITLLIVFMCTISPCIAQTVNHHHKIATKHKRVAHTSTKQKPSHKLNKYHTITHSKHNNITAKANDGTYQTSHPIQTQTKLVDSTIPQPQFDSSFSGTDAALPTNSIVSNTALNNLKPLAATTPIVATSTLTIPINATVTDTSFDTSQIDTSQEALTALAYKTVETQRYSRYKLGGTVFNTAQGIYTIDCSAYINDLLSEANPQAFTSLTNLTQTYKPTSHDYYKFITRLPEEEPAHYWRKISSVGQLQPGGILVFLTQYLHRHHLYAGSGHVMLVMSKPTPHPSSPDTYQVKVADSAPSGHSNDTRLPHKSGIGIGTLLLKVDPFTGQPKAYAWKLNDHWRFHTLFAMAQPLGNTY